MHTILTLIHLRCVKYLIIGTQAMKSTIYKTAFARALASPGTVFNRSYIYV